MTRAADRCARLRPDVVLCDARRAKSADFIREIVRSAPDTRVVAFGVQESGGEILALAAAGTAGYIRDSAGSEDVVRVLERVMCDELPCSPSAAASLYRRVAALSRGAAGSGADTVVALGTETAPLSRRELEIAHLIDCGLTNKQIGRRLGIEAATVKNHVHNMCEKLKVHRRGEATARLRALLRGRAPRSAAPPDGDPVRETKTN
jgi:DNA-binding NarL/FixJ family response regulator